MTQAELRNGQRVWDAFIRAALQSPFGGVGWATTAQIAKGAGVSKPTAKKYMQIASEHGYCSVVKTVFGNVWAWDKSMIGELYNV